MDHLRIKGGAIRRSLLALSLSLAVCLASIAPATALIGTGTWGHLGTNGATPAGPALDGHVYEMLATPDALYAAGRFTNAGGIAAADRIAKWDGKSWSAIGTTPIADNGSVFAIAVDGDKVYAGGNFTNAGGVAAADGLAVFDGVSWSPFCRDPAFGASLQVFALQVVGSQLYVGGTFQNANGNPVADYLIACDLNTGAMTTTVNNDGDFTGAIYDLAATTDGTLYAGGTFTNLDQVATADSVASYNGTWNGLGSTPIGGIVRGLHANGMDVYVSSDGLNIGGDGRSDHLVKWDGSAYSPVGSDSTGTNGYFPSSATINELTTSGSLLFAAGSWLDANGAPTGDMFAYFDGGSWRPLGSNGAATPNGALNANTEGLAVFGGQVYAGGASTNAGGDSKANFAASRSLRLADATIAGPTGASVGNNIYNGTAAGQTKKLQIPRGTSKTFRITIWNDGIVPASFTLKGKGEAKGYTIKYFEDWSGTHANITAAVRNGEYVTPEVAATFGFPMEVVVTLSSTAAEGGHFVVRASSMPNDPKDLVKGVVSAK